MRRMDPATLHTALEQLEQATDAHAEWHENLLHAIFCGLPCDPNDLAASAHLRCRFGRWYYERVPAALQGDELDQFRIYRVGDYRSIAEPRVRRRGLLPQRRIAVTLHIINCRGDLRPTVLIAMNIYRSVHAAVIKRR